MPDRERTPPGEKAEVGATYRFGSARRPDGALWHVEGLLLLLVRKRRYGRRFRPRHYPAEPERRCASRSRRSEEHTSELQSLMRISYAVFCLKKKKSLLI